MNFLGVVFIILIGCSSVPPLETKPLETSLDENPLENKSFDTTHPTVPIPPPSPPADSGKITLVWPVKDGVVSQEFKRKKGKVRSHLGIDIAAPKGDEVFASHDGIIVFAGRKFKGFGKLVIIETDNGDWATLYSHLQTIVIKQGQRVKQGDLIGRVGRTGRASGYHLHYEVRKNREPVDPLSVLP